MQQVFNVTSSERSKLDGYRQHHSRRVIPENSQAESPSTYIPMKDFVPFEHPIRANKDFGDYFLSLIHERRFPVCEAAAWMHLTDERICAIFEGLAPAPNIEQIAVAYRILCMSPEERTRLTELAVYSWVASGLNPYEQINPAQSIFIRQKDDSAEKEEAEKTEPKKVELRKAESKKVELKKTEPKHEKAEQKRTVEEKQPLESKLSIRQAKISNNAVHHGCKKVYTQRDAKVQPPTLRMKVHVDMEEKDEISYIRDIYTRAGDHIRVDGIECVERNANDNVIHYGCRKGKHRIDLFKDQDSWYLDASALAMGEYM